MNSLKAESKDREAERHGPDEVSRCLENRVLYPAAPQRIEAPGNAGQCHEERAVGRRRRYPGKYEVDQARKRNRQARPLKRMRTLAGQEPGDDHRGLDSTEEDERPCPRAQTEIGKGECDRVQKELKTASPAAGGEGMMPPLKKRISIARVIAPEASRMAVKLAASMACAPRAIRQRMELVANAVMATTVRSQIRKGRLLPSKGGLIDDRSMRSLITGTKKE